MSTYVQRYYNAEETEVIVHCTLRRIRMTLPESLDT